MFSISIQNVLLEDLDKIAFTNVIVLIIQRVQKLTACVIQDHVTQVGLDKTVVKVKKTIEFPA